MRPLTFIWVIESIYRVSNPNHIRAALAEWGEKHVKGRTSVHSQSQSYASPYTSDLEIRDYSQPANCSFPYLTPRSADPTGSLTTALSPIHQLPDLCYCDSLSPPLPAYMRLEH